MMCARKKNSRKHCQSLNGSMDRALIAAWPHQSVIISMRTTEQPFDTKPVGSSAPVAMIPIFYTQHSECFRFAFCCCCTFMFCPWSLSLSLSLVLSLHLFLFPSLSHECTCDHTGRQRPFLFSPAIHTHQQRHTIHRSRRPAIPLPRPPGVSPPQTAAASSLATHSVLHKSPRPLLSRDRACPRNHVHTVELSL